jgi:hypothetical protein
VVVVGIAPLAAPIYKRFSQKISFLKMTPVEGTVMVEKRVFENAHCLMAVTELGMVIDPVNGQ